MLKPIIAGQDEAFAGRAEGAPSARWALASLSLSMLLSSLGTSIANVALPTLAQAFDASFQQVQWIVLAYLLAITTLIVSAGRLGDITGRRQLLLAGLVLFTLASVLCGVAPTLWLLIAARAAQGLGAAVMMALTMAFVGETVPKEKTGSAMGLLGTMSAIGTALGPSLGGVLIAGLGWRAIFLVNVPLGILTFLLAYRTLPADRRAPKTERAGFDVTGTLLLALTLAAYALAMTIGRGRFGPLNIALLLAAVAGAGLFVLAEARAASPLIRLATVRDPVLSASLATSALVSTVLMATLVVVPFYLSRALGLDAAVVGIVLSAGPLVVALTGVPAGHIADRFGAQRMTIVGLIGIAAGSFILSMLPATFGIPGYIAPIVVIAAGYALFQTANNTAVMADIPPDQRGAISGMLNLSRNLGLITGASVMGAVFALASATTDITTAAPEAVATGMRTTFAVASVLIVAALAIAVGSYRRTLDKPARGPEAGQMNGFTVVFQQGVANIDSTSWQIVGTGDFNGDGKSDILWRNDDGRILDWQMNANNIVAQINVATISTDWHFQGTGDFNDGGKSDVLWRNDDGRVLIWEMNENGIAAQQTVAAMPNQWHIQQVGDYNADGHSDILWRNDSGQTLLWEMNGFNIQSQQAVAAVTNDWHIVA